MTNQIRPYEPLTSENAALVLVDHQVQAGPPDTANKLRTAPLWGLRIKSRFMHDLASLTLEDAIRRHSGEAEGVVTLCGMPPNSRQQLITFLKSL